MALDGPTAAILRSFVSSLALVTASGSRGSGRRPGFGLGEAGLTEPAQRFLYDVIAEALEFRLNEAPAKELGVADLRVGVQNRPEDETMLRSLLDKGPLGDRIEEFVSDADRAAQRNPGYETSGVLLIDMLDAIQERWCNIWPFCRPRPDIDQ